mmetsp:Transcript_11073/g.21059  ORF Transcript_11073/g.21059 Transcript_11073/m.21059 type:complete len:203 (+) Transcript_11073:521-1129(+)
MEPTTLAFLGKFFGCGLGYLDTTGRSRRFHAAGHIDGIPKQLETSLDTTEDTRRRGPRMQAHAHFQLACIGAEAVHQFIRNHLLQRVQAITGKFYHNYGVIFLRLGKASGGNIAIPNRLYFENTPFLGNGIKCSIDGFQQNKHFFRRPFVGPLGKSYKVRKEDSRFREQIGNRTALDIMRVCAQVTRFHHGRQVVMPTVPKG